MSRLRGLAIAAASLVVFAFLGELAARRLDLVDRLNAYPRRLYVPTSDPDLPYRLRPGFVAGAVEAADGVRVNRHGLRGGEIADAPRPGGRRVLVLGDSVVHGHRVAERDAFPERLAAALGALGVRDVEVLNGGTSGWDTSAEAAFLERYGLPLAPTTVLLGVSLNDYDPPPVLTARVILTQNAGDGEARPWLANHSELYLLLRFLGRSMQLALSSESEEDAREPTAPPVRGIASVVPGPSPTAGERRARGAAADWVARRHRRFYAAPSGPGWERVRDGLARIASLTRERDVELVVVLFPESFQFDPKEPERSPQRAWLGLCRELALDCIDLWEAFARASENPEEELFAGVQHPNAAGYAVAARAAALALALRWGAAAESRGRT